MTSLRFSRGTGIAGAVVRFATWSPLGHVGFKLDDGSVLDATPEYGVALRQTYDDPGTEYWKIVAPKQNIADAIQWAKGQIGKPYDWTAIIGMGLRRDWHDDSKWFCSEFCEGAFDYAHWPLIRDSGKLDRITPRDLTMSTRIERLPANPWLIR